MGSNTSTFVKEGNPERLNIDELDLLVPPGTPGTSVGSFSIGEFSFDVEAQDSLLEVPDDSWFSWILRWFSGRTENNSAITTPKSQVSMEPIFTESGFSPPKSIQDENFECISMRIDSFFNESNFLLYANQSDRAKLIFIASQGYLDILEIIYKGRMTEARKKVIDSLSQETSVGKKLASVLRKGGDCEYNWEVTSRGTLDMFTNHRGEWKRRGYCPIFYGEDPLDPFIYIQSDGTTWCFVLAAAVQVCYNQCLRKMRSTKVLDKQDLVSKYCMSVTRYIRDVIPPRNSFENIFEEAGGSVESALMLLLKPYNENAEVGNIIFPEQIPDPVSLNTNDAVEVWCSEFNRKIRIYGPALLTNFEVFSEFFKAPINVLTFTGDFAEKAKIESQGTTQHVMPIFGARPDVDSGSRILFLCMNSWPHRVWCEIGLDLLFSMNLNRELGNDVQLLFLKGNLEFRIDDEKFRARKGVSRTMCGASPKNGDFPPAVENPFRWNSTEGERGSEKEEDDPWAKMTPERCALALDDYYSALVPDPVSSVAE